MTNHAIVRAMRRSKSASADKDKWDKLDVIFKAIGGVLIPLLIGYSVYAFNQSRTMQEAKVNEVRIRLETASSMLQIAVGILQQPAPTTASGKALRSWAISVMRSPSEPPPITEEVALALAKDPLPPIVWNSNTTLFTEPASKQALDDSVKSMLQKLQPYDYSKLFDCTVDPCIVRKDPIPKEDLIIDWEEISKSLLKD